MRAGNSPQWASVKRVLATGVTLNIFSEQFPYSKKKKKCHVGLFPCMSNMHGGYFPAQKMLMNIPTTTRSDTTDSLALFSVSTQFAVRVIPHLFFFFFPQPASMHLISCKERFLLIILYGRLDKQITSGPYFSFSPLAENNLLHLPQPAKQSIQDNDWFCSRSEGNGGINMFAGTHGAAWPHSPRCYK